MDLRDPTQALTPTLDGPVLAVLAQSGRPLTVGQIAEQATRGSEIGIRRAVARLVRQGIVKATLMGRNQVHELNREHIAAPVAERLAGLRIELWKRLREELGTWRPKPFYACAFGSAARGDGGPESDIDLLLVHQPLPHERQLSPQQKGLVGVFSAAIAAVGATPMTRTESKRWETQIDELHKKVQAWTGNVAQIVDISYWQWVAPDPADQDLFAEIERDAITLAGTSRWRSPSEV